VIIKGSSRAGPSQLSRHLQRTDTNERVEILQLDSPAGNLGAALRDWQFISTGTRGSKGLYHANIDPDARYKMSPEQWQRAVDVLEKELGLTGQPRTVVLHEKHGRQHIHVVWQRTDIDTMTLVPDSFNYVAHERASKALEQEFGHEPVPGKHTKRDREKQPEFPKQEISHAEWQQGERAAIDPRAFKEEITGLYQQSDNAEAFQAALAERDLILAKGDRRDYVLVGQDGQIYSLARQIKGVSAKDLRTFMADLVRETVPTVEEAKTLQRDRAPALNEEVAKLEAVLKARHAEEGERLNASQAVEHKRTAEVLDRDIAEKLAHFDAMQESAREHYEREHIAQPTGLSGVLAALKAAINPERAAEEIQKQLAADAAFLRVQEQARENLVRELSAGREKELGDVAERHAQQQREHADRFESDRQRYLREHEAAARLRAEIEERRRQQELDAEQQRTRDGPSPPDRAR
jgi:hypothetical protein